VHLVHGSSNTRSRAALRPDILDAVLPDRASYFPPRGAHADLPTTPSRASFMMKDSLLRVYRKFSLFSGDPTPVLFFFFFFFFCTWVSQALNMRSRSFREPAAASWISSSSIPQNLLFLGPPPLPWKLHVFSKLFFCHLEQATTGNLPLSCICLLLEFKSPGR